MKSSFVNLMLAVLFIPLISVLAIIECPGCSYANTNELDNGSKSSNEHPTSTSIEYHHDPNENQLPVDHPHKSNHSISLHAPHPTIPHPVLPHPTHKNGTYSGPGWNDTCHRSKIPDNPYYTLTCNGVVSSDACAKRWGASCAHTGVFTANPRVPCVDCSAKICSCSLVHPST